MRGFIFRSAVIALAVAFYAPSAFSIAVGDTNTFAVDEEGWASNFNAPGGGGTGTMPVNPNPPNQIPNGGPPGLGDGFLSLLSFFDPGPGPAPGSKLTAFNAFGQWSGDYIGAGVDKITMDVQNFGPNPVELYLEFIDGTFGNFAISSVGIPLAVGGGWTSISFDIGPGDLTHIGATSNADVLMNTAVLRILHNTTPTIPGPSITARVGFDNITAIPVPPAIALLASGLIGLCARRRIG